MSDKDTTIQWKVLLDGQDNVSGIFNNLKNSSETLISKIKNLPESIGDIAKEMIVANLATMGIEKAFDFLKEQFSLVIEESNHLQESVFNLHNTLQIFNMDTKENFDSLKEFEEQINHVTAATKEEVLGVEARNVAYGESVEQVKAQISAAAILRKLSNDTISLAEANEMLLQSFSGQTRMIARYSPELKTLDQEHAKSGDVVNILNEKYKNLTFNIGQTNNAIAAQREQLYETTRQKLGELFAPSVQSSQQLYAVLSVSLNLLVTTMAYFKDLGIFLFSIFKNLFNIIVDLGSPILELIKVVFNMVRDSLGIILDGLAVAALKTADIVARALGFDGFKDNIQSLQKQIDGFYQDITEQKAVINSDTFSNFINDVKNGSKDIADSTIKLGDSAIKLGNSVMNIPNSYNEALHKIQDIVKASSLDVGNFHLKPLLTEDEIKQMRKKYQDFIDSFETDDYLKFKNNLDKKMVDIKDFYRRGAITQKEYALAVNDYQRALDQKRIELTANQGTQWVNAVSGGISSIISTLGTMFDKIAPGVGTLFATILNFLDKTKEEMRQFINGLIDQILNLPDNIADSIPTIIETIINRIPDIISRLIVSLELMMPKIVINSITAVIQGLANILPTLMSVNFWMGIAQNLFSALMQVFKNFFQALFFGSSDTIATAASAANQALFNTNANAGTNKFQLKDLATERTAADLNQGVDAVITKGQKGLFQMLYEGLTGLFSQIWNGVMSIFTNMIPMFYSFGNYIWYGFVQYIGNFFYNLGTQIWNGLSSSITSAGGSVSGIFGGGGGGIIGSIGGAIGSIGGSFGFAEGGLVGGSAPYSGNSTGNDIIPAMLSPGEFVINRQQMANKDLSAAANAMGISMGGGISLTVNIAAGSTITENQLKQNFIPIIIGELKKASMNGAQIISKRGVY